MLSASLALSMFWIPSPALGVGVGARGAEGGGMDTWEKTKETKLVPKTDTFRVPNVSSKYEV